MTGIALLFASGFTAVTYEVLWSRQLGLVFGNTALSTATCLAVFFLGMSLGQLTAARRCASLDRPLVAYGMLEMLAAATTLGALSLPYFYTGLYRAWFDAMTDAAGLATAVRLALSVVVLLPPAFFLGATLPVMVEAEVRHSGNLARSATALYGANTLGGVLGALASSFWLAPALGFLTTYLVVAAVNVAIGVAAVALAGGGSGRRPTPSPASFLETRPATRLAGMAFASGCLALAIEVIWTRMLVQVLHNSVYSFAVVLAVMLIALGAGAVIVNRMVGRGGGTSDTVLVNLLIASGLAVGGSALVFDAWTDGLAYLGGSARWGAYVLDVFGLAAAVMLVPGTLLGTIFPYVMATAERRDVSPGATVGWLVAINTVGAVIGSLLAGFVLLPGLGLWRSLQLVACCYLLLAPLLSFRTRNAAVAVGYVVLLVGLPFSPLYLGRVDVDPERDVVLAVEDSAEGTVAVVRRGDVVSIKLNNSYTVGTNANIVNDRRKADLPLMLVPDPASVFFLGMGAGITAAAALDHPVERVMTCELVPAVARAARLYLSDRTARLFEDPRSRVIYGDGRTVLAATSDTYDVIIGDLFVPWHAGVANLYSVEHFRSVLGHLNDDGVFAQWLPLYQFTETELGVVARTMLEVFPLVTLWRGDLQANAPAVALFGHQNDDPLDLDVVLRNVLRRIGDHGARDAVSEALMMLFYAGNLSEGRAAFAASPVNTIDWPVIEYLAPIGQRRVKAGEDSWLTGEHLVGLYRRTVELAPLGADPYLRELTVAQRGYVDAGRELYESFVDRSRGDGAGAREHFAAFRAQAPHEVVSMFESLMAAAHAP